MRYAIAGIVIAVIVGAFIMRALTATAGGYISVTQTSMASPVTVVAPAAHAHEAAAIVLKAFEEIDARMSEWKPGSALTGVNRAAGVGPVEVPEDLRAVVRRAMELGDLTDGAFDITWAALWGLWDFKAEEPVVPDSEEIRRRVELVDYRQIVIDDEQETIALPRPGMLIGLGGIAKGTALNRAATALEERGFDSFLISAGGQILARGNRGSRPWRVGIRDPRGAPDEHFAELDLIDTSLSTSGDYERFFVIDGVRYHHVLDPRTGMPARGLRSVTVVCTDAELADALSTAFMIMGLEDSMSLADALADVDVLIIDDANEMHTSGDLFQKLTHISARAGE